ncbi:MAG: hypothetical protein R3E44_10965 [Paracoccaceae bacterium]
MLQMTIQPAATCMTLATGPTLADVVLRVRDRILAGELTQSTGDSYIGAIRSLGERLNKPLHMIEATLENLTGLLPENGFDLLHDSSNIAYDLKRRRVMAAVKDFVGLHAAQKKLRDLRDDWNELFDVLVPLAEGKSGAWAWHPLKLAALRAFALVARAHGWQPRDLNAARAQVIDDSYGGNKRAANRTCLKRLDEIRRFPEALGLLPNEPIGFDASHRREIKSGFPVAFETMFMPWIDAITKSGWDPVSQSFSDDHVGHAHVLRAALRCYIRIALDLGRIAPDVGDILPTLACRETQRLVAGEMFARHSRTKSDGHLEKRTSRKYLKGVRQVLSHLGCDVSLLDQILANNKDARAGVTAEKRMTLKNRRFCEALVNRPDLRRRFLFSYQTLRRAAESILSRARGAGHDLTKHEMARVRMLGACACFAAIEIGGAPIRVRNAMGLTCIGDDAQIRIPGKGNKPITVHIPAELTKNDVAIEFPIRWNRHGCHDTIRWYLTEIRPLFPHTDGSIYLFPAVRAPGRPMAPGDFADTFCDLMRTVVDLPMTPHQMRHGQTSLLLNAHPEEIEVIAKRIDDKAETLRAFYGWLDAMRLVERGQDLLVGLMDD